jgi:hypothetical protein
MNIIDAIKDENLLRPFLAPSGPLTTWLPWLTALRVMYGLPANEKYHPLIRQCTGRDPAKLPEQGFKTALFLTGRRSGKSRMAAVVGSFSAALGGGWSALAKGEKGLVPVLSPTVAQSRNVFNYIRGIFDTPMLRAHVVEDLKGVGMELKDNVRLEILPGDYRKIRGYTLLAAVIDEAAFFGVSGEEGTVKSDEEVIRAVEPGLATTGGPLIVISSPYARRGWCFKTYERHWGQDDSDVLVWNAPSRVMNPTLPEAVVEKALREDIQAAKSEYLAEFRDDIGEFINRAVVERLVVRGRHLLPPEAGTRYIAFADLSGGRTDDAALAISHRAGRMVVIDYVKRWRPPFNPYHVIQEMAELARKYRCRRITGDNFGAEFVAQAFMNAGMPYMKCEKPKSILYAELLPRISSNEIELLDDEVLVAQLSGLERRTRAGGRDVIDHPLGAHDDVANAVAGAAVTAACGVRRVGALLDRHQHQEA